MWRLFVVCVLCLGAVSAQETQNATRVSICGVVMTVPPNATHLYAVVSSIDVVSCRSCCEPILDAFERTRRLERIFDPPLWQFQQLVPYNGTLQLLSVIRPHHPNTLPLVSGASQNLTVFNTILFPLPLPLYSPLNYSHITQADYETLQQQIQSTAKQQE